jgi:hypothetical protein
VSNTKSDIATQPWWWHREQCLRYVLNRQRELTTSQLAVAVAIIGLHFNTKSRTAFAGLRTIGKEVTLSRSQVQRITVELEELGIVEIQRSKSAEGDNNTLTYTPRWDGIDRMAQGAERDTVSRPSAGHPVPSHRGGQTLESHKKDSWGSLASPANSALASPTAPDSVTMSSSEAKQQFADLIASIKATNVVGSKRNSNG